MAGSSSLRAKNSGRAVPACRPSAGPDRERSADSGQSERMLKHSPQLAAAAAYFPSSYCRRPREKQSLLSWRQTTDETSTGKSGKLPGPVRRATVLGDGGAVRHRAAASQGSPGTLRIALGPKHIARPDRWRGTARRSALNLDQSAVQFAAVGPGLAAAPQATGRHCPVPTARHCPVSQAGDWSGADRARHLVRRGRHADRMAEPVGPGWSASRPSVPGPCMPAFRRRIGLGTAFGGQIKVQQHRLAGPRQQHVGRLDIAVHDADAVGGCQSFGQ